MVVSFTAEPDIDNARVVIEATGGVPGERFYMLRRDINGSTLLRETSEEGAIWLANPATQQKNLFANPDATTTEAAVETRRNHAPNPRFKLPVGNLATGWTEYRSGTITANLQNDGENGQYFWTTSITNGSRYGVTSTAITFTATTARTVVKAYIVRGLPTDKPMTMPAEMKVDFKNSTTVVNTQTISTTTNWDQTIEAVYAGGSTITNVVITFNVYNNTGATVTAPQHMRIIGLQVEQCAGSPDLFNGDIVSWLDSERTYSWTGTAQNSASIEKRVPSKRFTASGAIEYSIPGAGARTVELKANGTTSDNWMNLDGDTGAMRNGMVAGQTYTASADFTLTTPMTGTSPSANARRILFFYKIGAGAYVSTWSAQAPNTVGTTRLSVTLTLPAGTTEAFVRFYNGSNFPDTVRWDKFLLTEGTVSEYWDGGSTNAVWDGVAHDSTSTRTTGSMDITLYDYEARQGLATDYIMTDELGESSAAVHVDVPAWGTWIKDPFRPFMNVKVLWNSDSAYTRSIERYIARARGAKYPSVQYDRRQAPTGAVRIAMETTDVVRAFIALADTANIVMLDVDYSFGVPVRYVSLGDISGVRVGASDRDLKWEARYFDLPIIEVAAPQGVPITQFLTYDALASQFGSYIAIPAIVETYNDLSAGDWE